MTRLLGLSDLVGCIRIEILQSFLLQPDREPTYENDDNDANKEHCVKGLDLKHRREGCDAKEVEDQRDYDRNDHATLDLLNFLHDIQLLNKDQRSEGYRDEHDKAVIEQKNRQRHNDPGLVDRFPDPREEGSRVHGVTRLHHLVESGVLEAGCPWHIFVQHQ